MTNISATDTPHIDIGFRPLSYFESLDPTTVIVSSILGEERRKDVIERLATGNYDPHVWGEWLTESKLDDSIRQMIGQSHPKFMGGEYLPSLDEDEIEIARIVCASVTQDVTSVRACRKGKRIYYRVVDEHEGEYQMARSWSSQPLTLGELIHLINCTDRVDDSMANGLVFSIIDWNLESNPDAESLRGFISVSSNFYLELASYFDHAINRYLDGEDSEEESE